MIPLLLVEWHGLCRMYQGPSGRREPRPPYEIFANAKLFEAAARSPNPMLNGEGRPLLIHGRTCWR